jgi:hypothetical protein
MDKKVYQLIESRPASEFNKKRPGQQFFLLGGEGTWGAISL